MAVPKTIATRYRDDSMQALCFWAYILGCFVLIYTCLLFTTHLHGEERRLKYWSGSCEKTMNWAFWTMIVRLQ